MTALATSLDRDIAEAEAVYDRALRHPTANGVEVAYARLRRLYDRQKAERPQQEEKPLLVIKLYVENGATRVRALADPDGLRMLAAIATQVAETGDAVTTTCAGGYVLVVGRAPEAA